jgi:hypothetical protein
MVSCINSQVYIEKTMSLFSLKPNFFEFVPTADLAKRYHSARGAFSNGDYELAAHMAEAENDAETLAMAQIMCGRVESGLEELENLNKLDDEAHIIEAFALWTLERNDDAETAVEKIIAKEWLETAQNLKRLIQTPTLNVLLYFNESSRESAPLKPGENFTVQAIDTGLSSAELPENKIASKQFDLILCLHTIPENMHKRVAQFEGPLVTVINDSDMNIPAHAPMLSRSDCILVGTSYEHYYLEEIYRARTTSFPGMRLNNRPMVEPGAKDNIEYDISFTGRAFKPYWPDKAKILFRIAAIDNPDIRIRILDGFLDSDEYDRILQKSRFNILTNRYGFSLMHGRTLDALWQGCQVIGYGAIPPDSYAPALEQECWFVTEENVETEIGEILKKTDAPVQSRADTLNEIFVDEPSNDRRTIKYALLQTILKSRNQERPARIEPNTPAINCLKSVQNLLKTPFDENLRSLALEQHQKAISARPKGIIITFNYAQLLWTLDRREDAQRVFQELKEWLPEGELDPQRDFLISHRFPIFNEMVPYHSYYMACIKYLATGSHDATSIRNVLMSITNNYLALVSAQADNLDDAKSLLEDSLEQCSENGSAAHLLAKVLFAVDASPEKIWDAVHQAVETYPPYLHDLLPFGLDALERLGESDHAAKLARQWAYFITRVKWLDESAPTISDQTWVAAEKYAISFPGTLRTAFDKLRSEGL